MITLYDPRPAGATLAQPTSPRHDAQAIRGGFFEEIFAKRWEFVAEKFREADRPHYAEMCDRFAEEHWLTAKKLNEAEQRMADLTAEIERLGGEA